MKLPPLPSITRADEQDMRRLTEIETSWIASEVTTNIFSERLHSLAYTHGSECGPRCSLSRHRRIAGGHVVEL